jgi:hypothetical protein
VSPPYLITILNRITAPVGALGPGAQVRSALLPFITSWAGPQLHEVRVSGSYAKATAINGGTDVDLFVSLKSDTLQTLGQIYNSLAKAAEGQGFGTRRQNVSIAIRLGKWNVDLVPAKRQGLLTTDHSVYVSRQRSWQKTNIDTHIRTVINSRRQAEIRLFKYWRRIHGLEFPSFAVELAVIKALQGAAFSDLGGNVWNALHFLRDRIGTAALPDPANASNNVADELTVAEKQTISAAAAHSLAKRNWNEVIW